VTRLRFRGARELATLIARASRPELEQIVRQLAGAGVPDHSVAHACGLDKQSVRRVLATQLVPHEDRR
jgi:hypothetical protein